MFECMFVCDSPIQLVSTFAKNCSRSVCKELCTAFHDQVRPQHLQGSAAGLCAENWYTELSVAIGLCAECFYKSGLNACRVAVSLCAEN